MSSGWEPKGEGDDHSDRGLIAGLVGATTVALWFLIIDLTQGRSLYTPTVLGAALFGRGAGLPSPEAGPDPGMVLMFTWVHGLAFVVVGGWWWRASWRSRSGSLAWPAILVANLLAAAAMGSYFRLRHPNLRVQP